MKAWGSTQHKPTLGIHTTQAHTDIPHNTSPHWVSTQHNPTLGIHTTQALADILEDAQENADMLYNLCESFLWCKMINYFYSDFVLIFINLME